MLKHITINPNTMSLIDNDNDNWLNAINEALPIVQQSGEIYKLPLAEADHSYLINEYCSYAKSEEVAAFDMDEDRILNTLFWNDELCEFFEELNHDYVQTILLAVDRYAIRQPFEG